jgi:hypothetical protein
MTTEKLNIISGGGINPNELIFGNGTGGFSVNSIMLKSGMSPIMTLNDTQIGGSLNKVSDLFNNLVIPNWALSYNYNAHGGGGPKDSGKKNKFKHDESDDDEDEDDIITDDLHDKLLELVKEPDTRTKKITRKQHKTARKQHKTKKNMKNNKK